MNTFRTIFIISVFIVELGLVFSFSVHFSEDDLAEEYGKLDIEMVDVGKENYTQALRKRVVLARLEKKKELAAKDKELGAVEKDKNSETVKVKVCDAAIGYRSRIERLENLLFPPWLLSTKLTREQRFFIASTIYTTKYSGVLHDRLNSENLNPPDYAMALQQIYGDLSNRFEHFQKMYRVPKTDEEWDALFEYLELVDEYEKKAMKVSLPALPIPPKKLSTGENRYFVLLDDVDFKATKPDVEKLFSSAVDPQGKTNICMIKKFKGLPSGFVAVDFITKLSKTIEEISRSIVLKEASLINHLK